MIITLLVFLVANESMSFSWKRIYVIIYVSFEGGTEMLAGSIK